ncbi:hypothetical protein SAMN04488516_11714 [Desulfonauticus submarinus]|uniref:Uncharacterized protein n=1 Tax=Desulfonauticus submarinus TaxID=206665 RepID=A0A1H0G9Q7_9BACT|nr:hypothetical protein [Desulfonauticus submarinus]SDO03499.1 hypothetical protein SAMN04488516_11714 [Desulfonauticus submarinus]
MKNKTSEKDILKNKVLVELMHRVGKQNAISMQELHRLVFGQEPQHDVHGTRRLREIITDLRKEGVPIASTTQRGHGGYYIPVGSEKDEYCRNIRNRALKLLMLEAKIKKVPLHSVIREISLSLGG